MGLQATHTQRVVTAMMKTSNRWLCLLGAAAVMLSAAGVLANSSSLCSQHRLGDGECDSRNNIQECGYDGGDCCSCTCEHVNCGGWPFACIDPSAECVDDDDITAEIVENCGDVDSLGNGHCSLGNNKEECGFDGGDCCSCTCEHEDCGAHAFACIDPNAECVDDDDITADMVENCNVSSLRDGDCDQNNNKAVCGYDGGDCCSCTCDHVDCGAWPFACIDPSAECVDDDDITAKMVDNNCYVNGLGDGRCDQDNNKEECGYDWGDCCPCTCESDRFDRCTEFACIDPDAECVDDDDITADMVGSCGGGVEIGNGHCDGENNNAECAYDGGDCCACTCVATDADDGCDSFACIDPAASCVNDDDVTTDIVANCDSLRVGNGSCDEENNIPECGYDGGDCCECTCVDQPDSNCGQYTRFACIDPAAACVDDDDFTVDMLDACDRIESIGNGYCERENNKPECNYDGGDCCECTCEVPEDNDEPNYDGTVECGTFACIDPAAPCVDDDSVTVDMLYFCNAKQMGDGFCDISNNIAECAYDGGDCCDCTCVGAAYSCRFFACVDPEAACVDDDSVTIDMLENCGSAATIGDGDCDDDNNREECGYDGGDCCECTCDPSTSALACIKGFACIDPAAACADDDSVTADMIELCDSTGIGDGSCNMDNNNAECAFDGGDCCECTCENPYAEDSVCSPPYLGFDCKDPSASCYAGEPVLPIPPSTEEDDDNDDEDESISYVFVPWEDEEEEEHESLSTIDGAVEVGTKTEVGVSATAYDVRPGLTSGEAGCGEDGGNGCAPDNTRDGISGDVESRWSCASKLVNGGGPCQIEFTFGEPQDVEDIQVAFWKGDDRTRTLGVYINGLRTHTHGSYAGSTFNTLGVQATGVGTVMLEAVDLLPEEWISLLEVFIFVTP